ncbi:MAG TPA: tetratricopeptide repeat protein, partial [Methanocorpusculum sp.]|nr:tetratricopeptide repeat protein [Methanocorpusculum sp.]
MSVALLTNAQEKAASREYEAAENLFREYLKENETDASAWADLGYVLLKQQKLYESGDAYAAAYDLEPENPKYISLLGNALAELHQFEEAKLLFEKASDISGNQRCHIRVGDMLGKMGKYDEALVLYSLLAADNPENPTIQHRMVKVYEALGRPGDAAAALAREMELREKIVQSNPSAKEWRMYADTKARLSLWAEAEDAFRKSLELEETAEIHLRIGAVLVMQNKTEEGLLEFAKAAEFDSED